MTVLLVLFTFAAFLLIDQGRLQPGWRILFLRGERHRRLRRVARAVMVNQ